MANITKLELQQRLAVIGVEVQALRLQVSQLTADNERLRAAKPSPAVYVPRARGSVPAHFVAARELAMKSGACVKVVAS